MRARASVNDASSVLGEQLLAFSMSRLPLAASCRTGCPCRACIRMMKGRAVCRSIQAQCARAYVEWTTRHQSWHSRSHCASTNPGTAAVTASDQPMPPDARLHGVGKGLRVASGLLMASCRQP